MFIFKATTIHLHHATTIRNTAIHAFANTHDRQKINIEVAVIKLLLVLPKGHLNIVACSSHANAIKLQ